MPRRHGTGTDAVRHGPAALLLAALLAACALSGCAGQGTAAGVDRRAQLSTGDTRQGRAPESDPTGGRIGPAYEQWLYRQSMLYRAQELTGAVSASPELWRHGPGRPDLDLLLRHAPTWLEVNPWRAGLRTPALDHVRSILAPAKAAGFGGLWLSPLDERDQVWTSQDTGDVAGRGTSALAPDHAAGSGDDLARALDAMEAAGLQPGSDLVPAATGLGPDFMLQARGSLRHRGLYAMMEVPERLWPLLPEAKEAWDCRPLPGATVDRLVAEDVLPAGLGQDAPLPDTRDLLPAAGWAVTGPVLGVDGQTRRLAYRHAASVRRPVLCWQDPSGNARTLLAGAVILTTGERRQALAGISLAALAGLDATGKAATPRERLAPAPQALEDLAGQVHRYGGWSLLADPVPTQALSRLLESTDFVACTATGTLALQALESGDATPLARHLKGLLDAGVDMRRLAHGLHAAEQGPDGENGSRVARLAGDGRTAQGLARDLHALMALPVGLPGLCFLSLEELEGMARPGSGQAAFPFLSTGRRHRNPAAAGAAAAKGGSLEGVPAASPALLLAEALAARADFHVAGGRLVAVQQPSRGTLACTVALPAGGLFLTVVNFSPRERTEAIALPGNYRVESYQMLATSQPGAGHAAGGALLLSLQARQAVHILVAGSGM